MHPWGHLGAAYLLYSLYLRGRYRRPPRAEPALAVVFGSQFADLIDKPLGWWLGVFPTGRALAHSLLFAAVLIVIVYVVALVLDRVETATAFIIGHMSHLITDLPPRFFLGYPSGIEYLFWPFLSYDAFDYGDRLFEPPALVAMLVIPFTETAAYVMLELTLFGLAIVLWLLDGRPGIHYFQRD